MTTLDSTDADASATALPEALKAIFGNSFHYHLSLSPFDEEGETDYGVRIKGAAIPPLFKTHMFGFRAADMISTENGLIAVTTTADLPITKDGEPIAPSFWQFDEGGYHRHFYLSAFAPEC